MIQANELKPGNWVLGEEIHLYNQNIHCNGYTKLTAYGIYCIETMEGLGEKYDPIPLTPEILVAAGFVKVVFGDVQWCVPADDPSQSFEICVWSGHVSYTMANGFHLELKSLHQLQNLFFALTGKELNIVL